MVSTLVDCVSTQEVTEKFHKVESRQNPVYHKRTIVLFLVDGLGNNILEANLHHIPNIASYFHAEQRDYALAHSIFPSLTYPNLMSLLTRSPMDGHSVIGNQMLLLDENSRSTRLLDFEKREDMVWLNTVKEKALVFDQLKQQKRLSTSFAQSLFMGSTAEQKGDIPMGLSYLNKNYLAIDKKNITALIELLNKTAPSEWPDFIFIHLVGVDGLAHDLGPFDPSISAYLKSIDQELSPVFARLTDAQRQGNQVATLLTADHGFIQVRRVFDLDKYLQTKHFDWTLINEGRHAAIYFESATDLAAKESSVAELAHHPDVELTIFRKGNVLNFFRKNERSIFKLNKSIRCGEYAFAVEHRGSINCPQDITKGPLGQLPPFAVQNLLSYFAAPQHPDAVVIAASGISFYDKYHGHHGGLTEEEVVVPLLLRGVNVKNQRIPALYEILKILDQ